MRKMKVAILLGILVVAVTLGIGIAGAFAAGVHMDGFGYGVLYVAAIALGISTVVGVSEAGE